MRELLILAAGLTAFAVFWLIRDWFNNLLNAQPFTFESGSVALAITQWVMLPFILLFNLLLLPAALVAAAAEPLCGCGSAVAAPVLIALAMLCGLTSGGIWLYRRRR